MYSDKIALYDLPNLKKGIFISRPNRFIAEIKYKNKIETAHIHDPGRLKELLIKGVEVLFNESNGKLKYYIRAVKAGDEWVLIDTAQHSKIAKNLFEYLEEFNQVKTIKSEVKVGNSRIDFILDDVPLEVKGVTLVKDDLALFPDAPTKRGTRHIGEIIKHKGIILFLLFRNARSFAPNRETDPDFSEKLSEARVKGITILCHRISFDGKTLFYEEKIRLNRF